MSSKVKAVNIRKQRGLLTAAVSGIHITCLQKPSCSRTRLLLLSARFSRTQLSRRTHSQLPAAVHGDGVELLTLVTGQPDV